MKRLAVVLSLLALSGALVFPSAAAPFGLGQSDAITQDVSLAPTTAPNGDYAYLDENDELVVDLSASNPNLEGEAEGVNPDGVTTILNVFRVHYNGTRYAHVWLSHESDAVTFLVNGEPIQSEANNVTLGPNSSVAVGLAVNTTGSEPTDGLIDDVTIHAQVADGTSESSALEAAGTTDATGGSNTESTSPESRSGGQAVQQFAPNDTQRSITVYDPPTVGSADVSTGSMAMDGRNLTLDGLRIDATDDSVVSLDITTDPRPDAGTASIDDEPGVRTLGAVRVTEQVPESVRSTTLTFSVASSYLNASGVDPSTLAVFRTTPDGTTLIETRVVGTDGNGRIIFEADSPGFSTFTVASVEPAIGVTEATVSTAAIPRGERTTVSAVVSNDGWVGGTKTLQLTLDGTVVAEQTVTVDAGETTTVEFTVSPDDAGSYELAVDGTPAGSLTVGSNDDASASAGDAAGADDDNDAGTAAVSATADPVREPAGLGLAGISSLVVVVVGLASALVGIRYASR